MDGISGVYIYMYHLLGGDPLLLNVFGKIVSIMNIYAVSLFPSQGTVVAVVKQTSVWYLVLNPTTNTLTSF